MRFTLDGKTYDVTAQDVRDRLRRVVAEPVRQLGVRVDGTVYPVKQAFEVVVGHPRAGFTSHTARRILAQLGFELVGDVAPRGSTSSQPATRSPRTGNTTATTTSAAPAATRPPGGEEWHRETNVQAAVITHLATTGWRVLSVADTARRETGIDVTAVKDGVTVGVEVKGYPSREYADPARQGQAKPTQPSTQARHWYASAVLSAMITITRQPECRPVIALPDVPRYRDLHHLTRSSLDACSIEVWWVSADGRVTT